MAAAQSLMVMAYHVLSVSRMGGLWIREPPAICGMIENVFQNCTKPLLGDGHVLNVAGSGVVLLDMRLLHMRLPRGKMQRCKLHNVLYVPSLSYNLFRVSRIAE